MELAEEKKLILMVGHTFLFNNAIKKLKELISNNSLGKIYYINSTRTHLGPIREDVDVVWDLAAHDISIFNYLLDKEPEEVSAVGGFFLKENRCDTAFINLFYENNILAHIHISWLNSNKVRQIEVVGEKQRILFDDLNNLEKLKIFQKGISVSKPVDNFGEFQYLLRDGDIISPKIELKEPLMNQCLEFIKSIKKGKVEVSDGRFAWKIVNILEKVEESIKLKGKSLKINES